MTSHIYLYFLHIWRVEQTLFTHYIVLHYEDREKRHVHTNITNIDNKTLRIHIHAHSETGKKNKAHDIHTVTNQSTHVQHFHNVDSNIKINE